MYLTMQQDQFQTAAAEDLLMNSLGMVKAGETLADAIIMIINCAISLWVFFPIFKIIFKEEEPTKTIK